MYDIEPFRRHILTRVNLTAGLLATFTRTFEPTIVRKKQFIAQPDFVTRHRTYVLRWAFRSYIIGADGTDQTIQFAVDD